MSDIKSWSSTATNNNAAAPDGFPEGMAFSAVNDAARETMAAIRRWYNAAQWQDLGDVPTYASATTFTTPTDRTAYYTAGRRLKLTDATTLYGKVSSSSYSAPNTTVTVTLDSGSLSASLSAVAVSFIDPSTNALPTIGISAGGTGATTAAAALTALGALALAGGALTGLLKEAQGANIASASTTDLSAATGNFVVITGSTTITSLGTVQAGTKMCLGFTGTPKFTYNATSLIIPGAADYTVAAGDYVEALSLGSGNWEIWPILASGKALVASSTGLKLTAGTALTLNPYALNTTTTQAHGLGAEPTFFKVIAECLTTNLGYSVGDRVNLSASNLWDTVNNDQIAILGDSTNTTMIIANGGGNLILPNKSTRSSAAITAADWKIVVTPYLAA